MAVVLLGLALLYEVGVNVALSTHAIAALVSRHPEKLRLEHGAARSFWPGRVHVEALDLRGREKGVEWQLHIDGADANISLVALLHRRFQVDKVTATGVIFRARLRLEPGAVNADRVARMPPIEGFESLPLRGVPPDPARAGRKPWTVDVQGVEARGVREVWIDAFRIVGLLSARGGFTIGHGLLTLVPSSADVASVSLTTGEDAIATDVTGRVDALIETVDTGATHGAEVIRFLTMSSKLKGRMGSVRFIRHFLEGDAVSLAGGSGVFASQIEVRRGVVTTGTSSRVDLEPAKVTFGERALEGRARFELTHGDAAEGSPEGWNRVDVSVADLALTDAKAQAPTATCEALKTTWTTNAIDLAEPVSVTRGLAYSWDAPRIDVPDLHALDAVLPGDSPFHVDRGVATAKCHGDGSLLGMRGESSVESTLGMTIDGARVAASVRGAVPWKADFAAPSLDLSGAELTMGDPALPDWWAKVAVGAAKIRFAPASLALALSVSARNGRPFLRMYEAMATSSSVAKTTMSLIPAPLVESMTANLRGTARLDVARGALDLERLDVEGAASRLRGRLTKRGARLDGGLLVEAGPTALGVAFDAGKTSLVLLDAPRWFSTRFAPTAR